MAIKYVYCKLTNLLQQRTFADIFSKSISLLLKLKGYAMTLVRLLAGAMVQRVRI